MNREEMISALLARADDDVRRPALDAIDGDARSTNTFGSKAHRAARDQVEAQHDDARRAIERLSDVQLDAAIADSDREHPVPQPRGD